MRFQTLERDGTEEPRRHDPIRVDVVASEREAAAGDMGDRFHE
jgi:hypothetical protein